MVLPKKKVPPPPKQPGTHTNAEVKEALHARALRRTIIVTAVVVLLLAALAVISSIAQEYQGEDQTVYAPKAVIIVADGLTPNAWDRNIHSNKAPFTRLLNSSGGIYTTLSAAYNDPSANSTTNLVRLLTGSAAKVVPATLAGATSFLKVLKKEFKPVVVAPAMYWSSNQMDNVDNACARVGFFDAECTGKACPGTDEKAYCNAFCKLVSCSDRAELYNDDVLKSFAMMLSMSADLLYMQLTSFATDTSPAIALGDVLQRSSTLNLLDDAIGRIALGLAERTKFRKENWLIIVTSDGANAESTAPLLMAAYSNGQLVQLKRPQEREGLLTSDIRGTVLKWFNVETNSVNESRLIGICSGGVTVSNCVPDPNVKA